MRPLFLLILCSTAAAQTPKVTRLEFKVDPSPRVRPLGSVVLQIKAYGEATDAQGNKREGRVKQVDAKIATPASGAISKPFKYQGTDSEASIDAGSGMSSIFRNLAAKFTEKDAVVYHAPEQPGKYKVEASFAGLKGEVEIEVAADVPDATPAERWTFAPEARSSDPYRALAEHHAPFIAQETWFDWRADALCRTDFDQDWNAGNNWDNLGAGSSQAYVYYAAIESESHWFLIYNFFHARDYSDNCVAGMCHENDNEGAILTVRKDGSAMGKLEAMETLAHNNVYSYTNEGDIRSGAHNIESKIYFHNGSHPVVFLEAGGHGALGGGDKKSFFDAENFKWKQNTGITYLYKGTAERPRHAMDREVGYELLSIEQNWWPRAQPGAADKTFSAYYTYQPFGGRPGMKAATIGGSFAGVKHGADKAKPFWGWHDEKTRRGKILNTGQWGADPAYGVSQSLRFPASRPVSLKYIYNPYLGVGEAPAAAAATAAATGPIFGATTAGAIDPIFSATTSVAVATEGSCEIDVTVDGVVRFQVVGDQPQWEVLNGAPQQVKASTCTAAAPPSQADFVVEKKSGRGDVRMVEKYQGRVEINDKARGAGDYKLVVRWKPLP